MKNIVIVLLAGCVGLGGLIGYYYRQGQLQEQLIEKTLADKYPNTVIDTIFPVEGDGTAGWYTVRYHESTALPIKSETWLVQRFLDNWHAFKLLDYETIPNAKS